MRRRYVLAFALTMAAMLAWAPGSVAAGHALVVGSSHTTNSDFQNADVLSNFTVESDSVTLESSETDGFEDNDLSEYTFHGTDTGSWGTTTAAKNGSYAGEYVGNGNGNWEFARHDSDHSTTKNATISGWVYTDSSSFAGFRASSSSTGIDGVEARYRASDGDFVLYDGESGANLDSQNTALSGWAYIALEYDPSTGDTTAWIDDDTDYRTNPIATLTGSVSNDGDTGWGPMAFDAASADVRYDDITYGSQGDDPSTAQYISANHSVSQAEEVWTNVTLTNGTFTVAAEAWDPSAGQWQEVNSASYSSTGNYTLDVSGTSYDTWRVNVTFEKTGTDPTAKLHDEGVLFRSSAPSGSNLEPADGAKLSSSSTAFSVDVNDTEFGLAQGDSITATLYIDGQQEYQESITSNQTVSTSQTLSEGGDHTYHWVLTDSYGESTTTATKTITVPANVEIRRVSEDHALIQSPTTVEITIAGSNGTVDKRTVSDGNISMSGLDVTESYVFVVDAEGYYQRAIYLESIYEQSTVFLLNKSTTGVSNGFVLVDNTGQYNDQPKLIIERIINRSIYDPSAPKTYQWTVIAGDRLGADSRMVLTLEKGARYRIKAKNTEGDIRSLGEYTAKANETVTLTIGTIRWQSPEGDTYQVDAWQENVSGTEYVKFAYSDPDDNTSKLTLRIHEQGNTSNELFSATETNLGNYTESVPIPANSSVTWVANYTLVRGGETTSYTIPVGSPGELPLPIEEKWLTPMVYLVFVGVLSATPKASARTGAVVVASLGILVWWFAWAPLSGPAVGVAGAIALIGKAGDYAERM